MKVVILAGGKGSRLGQLSLDNPKALIPLGGIPIIIHLMKMFCDEGHKDFIIATGHLHERIFDFFKKSALNLSPSNNPSNPEWEIPIDNHVARVQLIFTGTDSPKEHRLIQLSRYLDDDFILSWTDALTDLSFEKMIKAHTENKKLITLGLINPPSKYGIVKLEEDGKTISQFEEKKQLENIWVNSGFSILSPQAFGLMSKNGHWENDFIQKAINLNQAAAYCHQGFWHCMDNIEEKDTLEHHWKTYRKWTNISDENLIER